MRGIAIASIVLALMLGATSLGCSAQITERADVAQREEAATSTLVATVSDSVAEQIATITGRKDADLVPIEGAQA